MHLLMTYKLISESVMFWEKLNWNSKKIFLGTALLTGQNLSDPTEEGQAIPQSPRIAESNSKPMCMEAANISPKKHVDALSGYLNPRMWFLSVCGFF